MRIGIVSDIHENVEGLKAAVDTLRADGMDTLVFLGDVVATGKRVEECARILLDADAQGVFGNHEMLLTDRASLSPTIRSFLDSLAPMRSIEDCLFSHIEPWLDHSKVAHLWYLDGAFQTTEDARRSFDAQSELVIFLGHYHLWRAAAPTEILSWEGEEPLHLDPATRYLVAVPALYCGHFALADTETNVLHPHALW